MSDPIPTQTDSGNSVARNHPTPTPQPRTHGDPANPVVPVQQTTPSRQAAANTGEAVRRVVDADHRNRSS
jgi:hypothetical protein